MPFLQVRAHAACPSSVCPRCVPHTPPSVCPSLCTSPVHACPVSAARTPTPFTGTSLRLHLRVGAWLSAPGGRLRCGWACAAPREPCETYGVDGSTRAWVPGLGRALHRCVPGHHGLGQGCRTLILNTFLVPLSTACSGLHGPFSGGEFKVIAGYLWNRQSYAEDVNESDLKGSRDCRPLSHEDVLHTPQNLGCTCTLVFACLYMSGHPWS